MRTMKTILFSWAMLGKPCESEAHMKEKLRGRMGKDSTSTPLPRTGTNKDTTSTPPPLIDAIFGENDPIKTGGRTNAGVVPNTRLF